MKIRQAHLRSFSADGSEETLTLTTWLDVRPELKKDAIITLKEYPGVKWKVVHLYDSEHEAADFDWHRKWDNNI